MLDLWIVGVFLILTLIVGIWQSKGITSLNVFSLANRNYSTAILVATITATFLTGGAALGNAEKTFKYGLLFLIVPIGDIIYSLIIASVVAPKIDRFKGCISIGDMVGKSYGKNAKLIVGITGTLYCITSIGAQASAIGYIFHYFLGFSHLNGILIGLGIIVVYSSTGGMKAVTITDVIQFIVLMIAVPMICNLGLSKIGGYNALYSHLSNPSNNISSLSKQDIIRNIDVFLIFALTFIGPTTVPRLLMARNAKQAVHASYYSSMIYMIFFSLISIIGLSAKILKPDLDPVLALPYIVDLLPMGFRGLAVSGLIAIVMSTADSVINTASVLIVNDIITPLSKRTLSEETKLKIARSSTIFIGIFAIIAAVSLKSVLDIMVLSYSFWNPMAVIPFFFALLGFIVDKKSFFGSAFGGCITVILWKLFRLEDHIYFSEILPGMIGSTIFFFATNYYYKVLKPEQFEPIPALVDPNGPIEGKKKSPKSNLGLAFIRESLLNFWIKSKDFSLVDFSHNKVKEYGASHQLFASFTILNYVFFIETKYSIFLFTTKILAGILCVGLFFIPEFTKKYSRYYALYWHFTLMMALPFVSLSMVLLHNGDYYWLFNMAISMFFLAILVDWQSFLALSLGGLISSCIVVRLYLGYFKFAPVEGKMIIGLYMIISSIIIGAFFSRRRENFIEEKLFTLKALGASIAHELRTPVGALGMKGIGIASQASKLLDAYKLAKEHNLPVANLRDKELNAIQNASLDIENVTNESLLIIEMLLTKLKDPAQETVKDTYSIKQVIEEAINRYPLHDAQRSLIQLSLRDDFNFYGNKTMFTHVIFNLLKNALHYVRQANKGNIIITSMKGDNNQIIFRDTAKGIPSDMLPHIFDKFYSKTEHGTGLGLAFCKLVVEELGGNISCKSIYGEYTDFIITLPSV